VDGSSECLYLTKLVHQAPPPPPPPHMYVYDNTLNPSKPTGFLTSRLRLLV
jgi:hypothetical protein